MQSRVGCNLALGILVLLLLIGLALWIGPQVKERLSPMRGVATIGEELERRLNPTPTIRPSPATIIRQIRSLSRLETVSYTVEKVITAESGQDVFAFLFGDRLLFVAHGQVIAGVDLGKIQEGDITITEDDRVVMVLPPAEVFVATLDNEKSFVYDRETGLLGLNQDLESAARQAAEEEILNAALADGILAMAQANAEAYLERLITSFGFQEVVFVLATPAPTPATLPVTVIPSTITP